MRVLVVSGIWPPDVGGPASHAPDAVEYLRGRGHAVEVVVTADRAPALVPYPVHWISRRIPVGARHVVAAALIARRARRADVIYTTGMYTRSAAGAWLARRPYVVKLTGDPAFERARRFDGARGFARFQQAPGGPVARALRLARDVTLRRAAHVFCPSAWLRELVVSWGVPAERASVLPNPAPEPNGLPARTELRSRLGFAGPTAAWAGRLTAQKSLEVAFAAVAQAGDDVRLVVAGDGPDRARLERDAAAVAGDRVRFLGPRSREEVLALFAAADVTVLSSSWENFPHAVVESLTVGTPVVSTAVGGVDEIVEDGVNGLLVPPRDPHALGAALRRYLGDHELQERLRAAAAPSVERFSRDRVLRVLERGLEEAAA